MAALDNTVLLKLPVAFVEEIRECLLGVIEEWDYTADYVESGLVRDGLHARHCENQDEALARVGHYRGILVDIEAQLAGQSI